MLESLLAPRSIAIVGLSSDPSKHGGRVLANLSKVGFSGRVVGVNPKLPSIEGIDMVGGIGELDEPPDVAVLAVPAAAVPSAVAEAGEAGVRAAVVFAGGFAERGAAGAALQQELIAAARRWEIDVLGPNSGGVIAPASGVAMSFLTCLDRPASEIRPGRVGLVTQSGGTGSYVHNLAAARGGGLAVSVSTGNEAGIGASQAIRALVERDDVSAVAVVLETVRDGAAFIAALEAARAAAKPVVVCRIGTSPRGREMMRSHTGALATADRVIEEICLAMGAIVAETPGEMYDVAEVMAVAGRPGGDRIAIVTHSGGIAILMGDLAHRCGLRLPAPSAMLASTLGPLLDNAAPSNPLDMGGIIGGPGRFAETVRAFATSGEYDAVLAVTSAHPPGHTDERLRGLLSLPTEPPIVHLWMAGDLGARQLGELRAAQRPATDEPRAAVRALGGLVDQVPVGGVDAHPMRFPAGPMTEHEAKTALASAGIAVAEGATADTADDAVATASRLGYPVVVKVSSPHVLHKSEVGGVVTGLRDAASVRAAYEAVTSGSGGPEVLVERHVEGVEILAGALRDEAFGPLVMVGLGGVHAELLGTTAMAPAPLSTAAALRLVERSGLVGTSRAPRSGEPADADGLAAVLASLGAIVAGNDHVTELEINPLVWDGSAWLALDAAVVTTPAQTET